MRTNKDGLSSIQEYNQFKTRIFDAVDEWINYCDSDPEMGLLLDPSTLEVEICDRETVPHGHEWRDIATLVTDGQADADAVLDLADQFCFVR